MGMKTFLWSDLKIRNDQVKFSAKNIKPNFIDCDLSVKWVVTCTFGVVLYRTFHFALCWIAD